jgi:hypothetical protein
MRAGRESRVSSPELLPAIEWMVVTWSAAPGSSRGSTRGQALGQHGLAHSGIAGRIGERPRAQTQPARATPHQAASRVGPGNPDPGPQRAGVHPG